MNRRGFLKTLLMGAAVAAVPLPITALIPKAKKLGYTLPELCDAGFVYAPYIPLQISKVPIIARSRKLRANWNIAEFKDFDVWFGPDVQEEVKAAWAEKFAQEIDKELMAEFRKESTKGLIQI